METKKKKSTLESGDSAKEQSMIDSIVVGINEEISEHSKERCNQMLERVVKRWKGSFLSKGKSVKHILPWYQPRENRIKEYWKELDY